MTDIVKAGPSASPYTPGVARTPPHTGALDLLRLAGALAVPRSGRGPGRRAGGEGTRDARHRLWPPPRRRAGVARRRRDGAVGLRAESREAPAPRAVRPPPARALLRRAAPRVRRGERV